MEELSFEKNKEMTVRTYEDRIANDPLRGDFDPTKDFKGEVFVDIEWYNADTKKKTGEVEKAVRVTTCPYGDSDHCVWRFGPTITGDQICTAVRLVAHNLERDVVIEENPRCKAHIAHIDRPAGWWRR
ncbi:MAG: hypothetical protein M1484_02195 [Patescibacteria group bacterium]|nr:hypothetical protein [Patescibacteria group bacterium]